MLKIENNHYMVTELEKFGVTEATFIANEINAWVETNGGWDEFDCSDNFRTCRTGDFVEEDKYEEIRNGGCCGFIDIEIGPSPAGHFYKYGFNYGH